MNIETEIKNECIRCIEEIDTEENVYLLHDEIVCESCYFDECDRVEILMGCKNGL
jgi:uncharacterized UBP type Zn finger protein